MSDPGLSQVAARVHFSRQVYSTKTTTTMWTALD
jgi:hypothetical protein